MTARGPLAIAFIVAGLVLPLLPRWIVPLLRPNVRYLDNAAGLLDDPRSFMFFAAISVVPFVLLAIFTWFHLRAVDRRRLIAILVTFAAMFVVGWFCQMPQSVAGVNFAVIAFPIYAALAAPVAYGVGRIFAR